MAKILKVKVKRTTVGDKIFYSYPPNYTEQDKLNIASKAHFTCYEHVGDPESVSLRGGTHEYAVCVVSDADSVDLLTSPDIVELSQPEAIAIGDIWSPQIEFVSDPIGIPAIIAKLKASQALTTEENNAVDPDNPAPGISKSAAYTSILVDTLGKV